MNLLKLISTFSILFMCVPPAAAQAQSNEVKDAPLTVMLNVTVKDSFGKAVSDLPKDRFRVFEDEVLQKISIFEAKTRPLVFGIAVDASGSMRRQLSNAVGAGKLLVVEMKPEESAFVLRFVGEKQIEFMQELTSNKRSLERGLDNIYVEGGASAIIDALYESDKYLKEEARNEPAARRALVVMTDGEDRASFYKPEHLFARLRDSGLQVFVIALTHDLGRSRDRAEKFLKQLAQKTGGDIYHPDSVAALEQVARAIMIELRAPYVIGYEPTNPARDGKSRKLRVELAAQSSDEKLHVSVRPSFIP